MFGVRQNLAFAPKFVLDSTVPYPSNSIASDKLYAIDGRNNGRETGPATGRGHTGADPVPALRRESYQSVRWVPKHHVLLAGVPANRLARPQEPLQRF
jgi:hypothetical protein